MIKNVLIVGLGGLGALYASKIPNVKILVNKERLERYRKTPTIINDKEYNFDYILPDDKYNADLIIITTKFYNLNTVLNDIKNFVNSKTIILSLINGISSEKIILEKYPTAKVIPSFFIGNSVIRNDRKITYDDVNKIVMDKNKELKDFFNLCNINYEETDDIKSLMWQKFMLNITANQLSAVTNKSFGEMNSLPYIELLLNKILEEVIIIAEKEGIKNAETLAQNAISSFLNMAPYGKTSMLQDIQNNRRSEIDAFAGTIIKLGKKHSIPTPYNNVFYYLLSYSK